MEATGVASISPYSIREVGTKGRLCPWPAHLWTNLVWTGGWGRLQGSRNASHTSRKRKAQVVTACLQSGDGLLATQLKRFQTEKAGSEGQDERGPTSPLQWSASHVLVGQALCGSPAVRVLSQHFLRAPGVPGVVTRHWGGITTA